MAAAQLPPPDSLTTPHRRRSRRLVFDRRYGWIFDEWTGPAEQALSGGRGMFCAVTMARSLVNAAALSINNVSSSVSRILESSNSFCLPAYVPNLAFNKKQQAWLRELENSGVVADLKINFVSSSVSSIIESSNSFCLPAYVPNLAFNKKQQAWLRELENSGVVADLKLDDTIV